ncbi:MAG: hypothetical protein Q9209_002469 [Squamulea sp. 1 TL-2023]
MTTRREGAQPYVPRLTYRNPSFTPSISDHSIRTVGTQSSTTSHSTCATSPPTSSYQGSPRSCKFSDDVPSPLSLDGASDTRSSSTFFSPQPAKEPKKKSSSILKFFTVKEPSTQAFEAYQEEMKKRGTTQTGRANAVGLPGVSSAKLPPTVPKVNSKWDGVPQATKQKAKEKDIPPRSSFASSASRPLYTSRSTGSAMTTATTSSTSSTKSELSGNGKLRLDSSNGNLADLYGWEVPSTGTSGGSPTRTFPLESKRSATSVPTLQRDRTSFFLQSPSVLPTAYESPAETPPPLDPSSNRPSPMISPSLPMPPTPKDSIPPLLWSSSNGSSGNSLPLKAFDVTSNDSVTVNSSGKNILGPPIAATRRSGSAPFAAGAVTEVNLPSTANGRPPLRQPTPILKKPADAPMREESPLQTPPANAGGIKPSPKPAATAKSKRMHMMSIFGRET